jgi:phospholipid/cholesterol/gamma-HCH transport system ATP-binding protein
VLEFIDIKKRFSNRTILDGVTLSVNPGEVLFVVGTSGVGKSVLIKQVVGLLQPDSGTIRLDGADITHLSEAGYAAVRKRCALVLQNAPLFDSMTCELNVALPLRKHPDPTTGRRERSTHTLARAHELLAEVGVEDSAAKYPRELGDGLRKRVAIARALALAPAYMLFDEPTTGLDPASARHIDALIRRLADERHVACVVVSHDLRSIFSIADRVAMLYKGKVKALGSAAELKTSPDPVVAQFMRGAPDGPLETT